MIKGPYVSIIFRESTKFLTTILINESSLMITIRYTIYDHRFKAESHYNLGEYGDLRVPLFD